MEILGVHVDELTREGIKQKFVSFLQSSTLNTIFTPNPEMVVDAQTDPYFLRILNTSTLNLCDGRGLELAGRGKLHRFSGIDALLSLCAIAAREGQGIYLLGGPDRSVLTLASDNLRKQFPSLFIIGVACGPDIHTQTDGTIIYDQERNAAILSDIRAKQPAILFVGFGHGKQEKWIKENAAQLAGVRIVMGVGGAFDMLSGKIPRAPWLFRVFGLEWLWRLSIEPRRFKRIWKATGTFLFLYFKHH